MSLLDIGTGTWACAGIGTHIDVDPVAELAPLGGLERWLAMGDVTDVVVNAGEVWIDRGAGLVRVGSMSAAAVDGALERILAPIGRRLDRLQPMVDARLPDGSRICAAIPPIAVAGTCLAIRRFAKRDITLADFGDADTVLLLEQLVQQRCNVLVSGATSAGKTSLLGVLASLVEPNQRLVVLEDVAELSVQHPHVVRLETRPATADGVGAVRVADLVRTALRLRPDRLIVGEVRGDEATDLLQAMNTGHDGSLSTVHANSAVDALHRLATLVACTAANWPAAAIMTHVCRAVDVVVHVRRHPDGRRLIQQIAEVQPPDGTAEPKVRLLQAGAVVLDRGRR